MFVDRVVITVKGGEGGNGCTSFAPGRPGGRKKAEGGSGGSGGGVILEAREGIESLAAYRNRRELAAGRGDYGRGRGKEGGKGKDLISGVPVGTLVREVPGGAILGDLDRKGKKLPVARGGRGGKGNRGSRTPWKDSPREMRPGGKGEEKELELDLRLVADVVLVGSPNAGKSSLLSSLAHSRAKIAPYPFTTTEPVLGVVTLPGFERFSLVELPGLLPDSHRGAGVGNSFLKHLWRVKVIAYVVDVGEGKEPWKDFLGVREELRTYSPEVERLLQVVVATKMDLPPAGDNRRLLEEKISTAGEEIGVFAVSATDNQGLDRLGEALEKMVREGDKAGRCLKELEK